MIATALLLESTKTEGPKLLGSPFPSESNVRYPSLFLDHDFLLSSNVLSPADVEFLFFVEMVPTTLLLDLTVSAFNASSRTSLSSTKLASTERTAYRLFILPSKSDRPHLALNLIVRTVLDHPDASSWHRQLLGQSILRKVSGEKPQDVMSLLALSILEVLERQVTSLSSEKNSEIPDTT